MSTLFTYAEDNIMSMDLAIALTALTLQFIGMLVGGVWVVGRINSATDVLNNTVNHLNDAIVRMSEKLEEIEASNTDKEARLRVIEAECEKNHKEYQTYQQTQSRKQSHG